MTTNHDHEIKFKRLNNLKDPAANRTWITNIINICRSRKVHEIVDGSKEERGMLVYLLKARVFPTLEGEIPDGDEAARVVRARSGALVGARSPADRCPIDGGARGCVGSTIAPGSNPVFRVF